MMPWNCLYNNLQQPNANRRKKKNNNNDDVRSCFFLFFLDQQQCTAFSCYNNEVHHFFTGTWRFFCEIKNIITVDLRPFRTLVMSIIFVLIFLRYILTQTDLVINCVLTFPIKSNVNAPLNATVDCIALQMNVYFIFILISIWIWLQVCVVHFCFKSTTVNAGYSLSLLYSYAFAYVKLSVECRDFLCWFTNFSLCSIFALLADFWH